MFLQYSFLKIFVFFELISCDTISINLEYG